MPLTDQTARELIEAIGEVLAQTPTDTEIGFCFYCGETPKGAGELDFPDSDHDPSCPLVAARRALTRAQKEMDDG